MKPSQKRLTAAAALACGLFFFCGKNPARPDGDGIHKPAVRYAPFEEIKALAPGTAMDLGLNRRDFEVQTVEVLFEAAYEFEDRRLIYCRTPADVPVGAGDSGSPLSLKDGRVAGLLCYGYYGNSRQFAARPMEEVLTLDPSAGGAELEKGHEPRLRPVRPSLFASALDARYLDRMAGADRSGFFDRLRSRPALPKPGMPRAASGSAFSVIPGLSIAVFELSGDLVTLGAIGTLGFKDGNNLYAFGHPYSDLPTPLAAPAVLAKTATFIESTTDGFKLAAPTQDTVGSFTAQNRYGILVRSDVRPVTFPSRVTAAGTGGQPSVFRHRVVNAESPAYEKMLAALTASYGLFVVMPSVLESDSLFVSGRVRLGLEHAAVDTEFVLAGTLSLDWDVYDFIASKLKIAEGDGHIEDFQAEFRLAAERAALAKTGR